MNYRLSIQPKAARGLEKIRKSGNSGKLRQVEKALGILEINPNHPSLQSHKMKKPNQFGNREDLFISYVRVGPGGERIVWAYGDKKEEIRVLDVEYIGTHIDR